MFLLFQDVTEVISAAKIIYTLAGVIVSLSGAIVWLFKLHNSAMSEMAEKTTAAVTLSTKGLEDTAKWMQEVDRRLESVQSAVNQ